MLTPFAGSEPLILTWDLTRRLAELYDVELDFEVLEQVRDAKTPDYQAGMETGYGAILAALAGINVVSGPGLLDFESCQSLEKLVLDHETCGLALRLARGIEIRDEPIALPLLEEAIEEGDTESLREDILEAFTEEQVDLRVLPT